MFVCIVGLSYRLMLVGEHEIICFYKYTYEIDVLTTYLGVNKYYNYGYGYGYLAIETL